MYFFKSKRARLRVMGGFFDSHKAGKNLRLVNMLWALQLFQFVLVLISPCVFGVALHTGLKNSARFSHFMDWTLQPVIKLMFYDVVWADMMLIFYLITYVSWTLNAYYAKVI